MYVFSTTHPCLAIDYRLAPQHIFPAALQDMLSAYLFLIDPPPSFKKYDPSQITICGDSAGGNLALVTALWLRDSEYPLPGNMVLLSPWMDLTHSNPSFKLNHPYDYLPDQSVDSKYIHASRTHYCISDNSFLKHPLVSPLFADPIGKRSLPKTLIQIGDAEKLRDEALVFFEKFKSSEIQLEMYEDMIHVFHLVCLMVLILASLHRWIPLPNQACNASGNLSRTLKNQGDRVHGCEDLETMWFWKMF